MIPPHPAADAFRKLNAPGATGDLDAFDRLAVADFFQPTPPASVPFHATRVIVLATEDPAIVEQWRREQAEPAGLRYFGVFAGRVQLITDDIEVVP